MSKTYIYLQKLITAGLLALAILAIEFHFGLNGILYISIPIALILFSIIISRITGESPKELYNFQRSEKYFARGGLRDLLRIPVVLFGFTQDIVVWLVWGVYQLFVIGIEALFFVKTVIYWIFHALIWFLKLLVPFWRLAYKLFIFYAVKWPWWIYRYAYRSIKPTYNWNILRIALPGTFMALFLLLVFYFLDILLNVNVLRYFGLILAILPISWVFAEISSARALNLLHGNFHQIKLKSGNGIGTFLGILVYMAIFFLLVAIQAFSNFLGFLPKSGPVFTGLIVNLNFLINILLIFILILIVLGTVTLPSFRLYNEFSDFSVQNIRGFISSTYKLLCHITRRFLQVVFGLIPSGLFGVFTIVLPFLVVSFAFFGTILIKDNIIDLRIYKLQQLKNNASDQVEEYTYNKQIDALEYIQGFPLQMLQELKHRPVVKRNFEDLDREIKHKRQLLDTYILNKEHEIEEAKLGVNEESDRTVINQTRIEELQRFIDYSQVEYANEVKNRNIDISTLEIDKTFLVRKYKMMPLVFFLSGLFIVVATTLVFVFLTGFYGNFFYNTYIFRNDKTSAKWKEFISTEQQSDSRQPLLSTTLNIFISLVIVFYLFFKDFVDSFLLN